MSAAGIALQQALVAALGADAALAALIGEGKVFDAPPRGAVPPYLVVARHDVVARPGDVAPGWEHRLVLHAWHPDASRAAVLAMAARVVMVATEAVLSGGGLTVTLAAHLRTETQIDGRSGRARAAIALRFHSEPAD